ncbi:MAG: GNAT family N-acetyltransferase [Pseudonocardia sp.]|nr:GNAT family N-acetyltransferase [Pseudonocardia sp.]
MTDMAPVLGDGVVTLRPHRIDDVAGLVATGQDPESIRWTSMPSPYTDQHGLDRLDQVRTDKAAGTGVYWVIEALDGDRPRFAGQVDVRMGPPPDVGYGLAPWARGRGIMSRALRVAARWAFDELGLPILHWSTLAGNLASWRVAHACGFTFHAELPLALAHRGELADGWFAALRPGDEPAPRTTWWDIPVVEGERVRLRPLTDGDVGPITEACSDPTTQFYLAHLPDPYTEEDAHAFVNRARLDAALGKAVAWAVADRADDRLLAQVSAFRLDDQYQPAGAEIGY